MLYEVITALGSGAAFLTAQMMDIVVFDRLRRAERWWTAPLVSTLVGSSLDTAIFFSVAFSAGLTLLEPGNDVSWANEAVPLLGLGPMAPLWVSLGTADCVITSYSIHYTKLYEALRRISHFSRVISPGIRMARPGPSCARWSRTKTRRFCRR